MKKVLFTAIALATILSLSSCGDKSEKEAKVPNQEKPQATTSATAIADELTEVDVFENCEIHIDDTNKHYYPNNLSFFLTTITDNNINLKGKVNYNCIITGNCNKIVAEVSVDKDKCNEVLKDDGLKIVSDNKTYEFDLIDTTTMLLRKDQITDETLKDISQKVYSNYVDDRSIEKLYALLPKEDCVFFKDFECSESSHGIWDTGMYGAPKDALKLPDYQIFAFLPYDGDHTEIYECNPQFKDGKITERYQCVDYREEREGGRYESRFTNSEVNDVFERMISNLREEGYEFEVVEIPVPSK